VTLENERMLVFEGRGGGVGVTRRNPPCRAQNGCGVSKCHPSNLWVVKNC